MLALRGRRSGCAAKAVEGAAKRSINHSVIPFGIEGRRSFPDWANYDESVLWKNVNLCKFNVLRLRYDSGTKTTSFIAE